jgi:hypothetical protein
MPPAPPMGFTIDVFNFDGGRYRTCLQHLARGPPSTSSTSVVAATGHAASTPQGAHHRRLQLPWWHRCFLALMVGAPGPSASAPPGGPPSTFLTIDGGHSPTTSSGTSRGPVVDCRVEFKITEWDVEELAPPTGSQPLPRWANVKVVLRHFHQCCYRSSPLWFFCWRGFWSLCR